MIIIGIIFILTLMSLGGWILKGLSFIASIFFEGVGNCLGCCFKLIFYIFVICCLVMAIFA